MGPFHFRGGVGEMEGAVCTVELGDSDLCLCNILAINLHIMWYQLISHNAGTSGYSHTTARRTSIYQTRCAAYKRLLLMMD